MKKYNVEIEFDEITLLKNSLEVILDRQLNALAELNVFIEKNKNNVADLLEKLKPGNSPFIFLKSEAEKKVREYNKKLIQRDKVIRINRTTRELYLKIINVYFANEPYSLDATLKLKKIILEENREVPFVDFYKEWDETFF